MDVVYKMSISFTQPKYPFILQGVEIIFQGRRQYTCRRKFLSKEFKISLRKDNEKCFCTVIVKGNKFKKLFTVSSSVSFVNTVGSCF